MADPDDPKRYTASEQPPPNWGSAYPPPGQTYPPPPSAPHPPAGGAYYPHAAGPPRHPQATTAMVLGILGLVLCGFLAPFAWYTGAKAVSEIDASPWPYAGRSEANAGKIMGIVGTVLVGLGLLAFVALVAIGLASA